MAMKPICLGKVSRMEQPQLPIQLQLSLQLQLPPQLPLQLQPQLPLQQQQESMSLIRRLVLAPCTHRIVRARLQKQRLTSRKWISLLDLKICKGRIRRSQGPFRHDIKRRYRQHHHQQQQYHHHHHHHHHHHCILLRHFTSYHR